MLDSAEKRLVSAYCACIAGSKSSSPWLLHEQHVRQVAERREAESLGAVELRAERRDQDLRRGRKRARQMLPHGLGDVPAPRDQLEAVEPRHALRDENPSRETTRGRGECRRRCRERGPR